MEEAVIDKLTPPTPDPEPTPDKPEADVEVKGDAAYQATRERKRYREQYNKRTEQALVSI